MDGYFRWLRDFRFRWMSNTCLYVCLSVCLTDDVGLILAWFAGTTDGEMGVDG